MTLHDESGDRERAKRSEDVSARRVMIRRDDGQGGPPNVEANQGGGTRTPTGTGTSVLAWAWNDGPWGLPWAVILGFLLLMAVFSAIPMVTDLRDRPNKDYSLWYQVGAAIRQGVDIYPDPESGRLFPFMYPPSAAALLGFVSVLGKHGTALFLVLIHSAAWAGAIALSLWLAIAGKREEEETTLVRSRSGKLAISPRNARILLCVAPSLCIIALIHNTYLLGQPNLTLLTLLLGAFACLRLNREVAAGALVATAAAIKAFPILAIGYLIYRRNWRATIATTGFLAAWLLVVPLPFRTPAQAVQDLSIWSRGMIFTYNAHGIAQRPYRSFSYKNQSIMAMTHRLLRNVPADGEKAISNHIARQMAEARAQSAMALPRASEATDTKAAVPRPGAPVDLMAMLTAPTQGPPGDDRFKGIESSLQNAWRVNLASLDFKAVTAITLAAMLGLSLLVLVAMPRQSARTAATDAVEFALITLLIVMFSPLSFNYAYVWLIYPMTVALDLVMNSQATGRQRKAELAWIAAVFLIPGLAVAMPLYAQAYGNLFIPSLLLVIGLSLKLYAMTRGRHVAPQQALHSIHEIRAVRKTITPH